MLRKFLATVLIVISAHAELEKFQVLANNVDSVNNIMIAKGNVVIFSPTYYITAQKIIYDKNKGTFELFDDVLILKNNNVQTKSDYAFLDVNTDDLYQKPNMFFDQSNSIWINSKDSDKKNNLITLDQSILSSCDCVNPDWSIKASSADYDTEDKWINAYNTRLYVKDVPVFYSPYLGFSTDTERRTGLLIPTIGYSGSEGASYTQPIFIAPADNYDVTLVPQFKANRGNGMYAYVRYADSVNSVLEVSGGYFKEYTDYQEENDLENDEHYGLDIDYTRKNLFTEGNKGYTDGLYVDINYLNDIEYKTLQDDEDDEEQYVESKINYILDSNNYFLGSYFRYYIDTDSDTDSNSATMQELPKLQAHTYSRSLFLDKLVYSTDLKFTNYSRNEGLTANQYELDIPISYSFSFLDDYLQFTATQELVVNKYDYSDFDTTTYESGTYAESNTILTLSSDLIKPYENYLHTLNLSADYTNAQKIKEEGDLYFSSVDDSDLSDFAITKSSDSINFGINQSLYDNKSLKQIINHKLTQSILYDDYDNLKFQNMENEITYNYILGSVKNNLVYNFQDDEFIESSSSFNLTYNDYYIKLGHYMSKDTDNSGLEDLESYQIDFRYKISNDYSFGYYTSYNIEENLRSDQTFSFSITDQCWNFDIKYIREIEAATTTDGDPTENNGIYFELLLKPLGGIVQDFDLD